MKNKPGLLVGMLLGIFMALTSCIKDNDMSITDQDEAASTIVSDLLVSTLKATSFIMQQHSKNGWCFPILLI